MKKTYRRTGLCVAFAACAAAYGCGTGESTECSSSADCDGAFVCRGGTCVVDTCSDGVQNGDESDVDCGKACDVLCAVGKKCGTNADCGTDSCENHVCTAAACADPETGDILITEILNYANGSFQNTETPQMEFIEIYNGADHAVSLGHVSVVCERTDDGKGTKVSFAPGSVCVAGHGAVLLSKAVMAEMPEGVQSLAVLGGDNKLANNATYQCSLVYSGNGTDGHKRELQLHSVIIGKASSGVSAVLEPMEYISEPTDLYKHDEVNPALKHSPGYCTNGFLFADGCVSHCGNNIQDRDETDVDCGGAQCGKCANWKMCTEAADCISGVCDETHHCVAGGCKTDTDCAENGGTCDPVRGTCVSCSDGEKNGTETDIDCGGSCEKKCAKDQKCSVSGDCESGVCNGGVCVGEKPDVISPESLVINEVLGAVDANRKFLYNDNAAPCEFIEIVNKLDKIVSLDGLTLEMLRTDNDKGEKLAVELKGTVAARGVMVVHNCSALPLPKDASEIKLDTTALKIVDSATFSASMTDGTLSSAPVSIGKATKTSSYTRAVDGDGASEMVLHKTISGAFASPGYCANGGLFSEGCISHCENNLKDFDESDVDCGGAQCGQCGAGRACAEDSDCLSDQCESGFCTVGDCSVVGCESGQFCDIATRRCHSCSDGEANGDESDVDCGGTSCGGCWSGAFCKVASDCLSRQCQAGRCMGEASSCQSAAAGDLAISEFMNFAKIDERMTTFGNAQEQRQVEFVEIVNLTGHTVSLDGLKLVAHQIAPASSTPVTIDLRGCLPAKQVVVVSGTAISGLPEGVLNLVAMASADVFSNAATYQVDLVDGSNNVLHSVLDKAQAIQRVSHAVADVSASSTEFVDHNSISEFNHSPGFCANGGLYADGCVSLCANSRQDAGETDTDCGGSLCEKCANGKRCAIDSDCVSDYCNSGRCNDDPCFSPVVGDLVIDEVLNNVKSGSKMSSYDVTSAQEQAEFIEIVNLSNKALSLKGLTLKGACESCSTKEFSVPLSGCVPEKSAVVVSGTAIAGMPDGVLNQIGLSKATGALTNNKPYTYSLVRDADEKVMHEFVETIGASRQAVSRIIPTLSYSASVDVVDHDTINEHLKHSPGYCTNGGLFTNGCMPPCTDGIQNQDETDVDCGGSCGATCAYGYQCTKNEDCTSNNCSSGRCGYDQCHNGTQDGDETAIDCGGNTCDPCSNGLSCLADSDCSSGYCSDTKICGYNPCRTAAVGDLVISEVFNNVYSSGNMSVYDTRVTDQKQAKFIEIANLTDDMISLKDLMLKTVRQDNGTETKLPLSGCIPAKQAAVVSANEMNGLPPSVLNITLGTKLSDALKKTTGYNVYLLNSSDTVLHSVTESGAQTSQVSRTLSNLSYSASTPTLVDHTTQSALKHSPGYCANGKLYLDGCK